MEDLILSLQLLIRDAKKEVMSKYRMEEERKNKPLKIKPFLEHDHNSMIIGYRLALEDIEAFLLEHLIDIIINQKQ